MLTESPSRLNGTVVLLALLVVVGCETHRRLVRQDEVPILQDVRTVGSAQVAYENFNAAYPDTLQCLARPWECIRGYRRDLPPFVSETLADLTTENGYARAFHPGPPAPDEVRRYGGCSPSALSEWAYTVEPARDKRGRKAFCTDRSGRICAFLSGKVPPIVGGRCPSPCDRVQ
jgi:hypothetical protein